MTDRRQATIVGIFALSGVVVLAVLVFLFGGGRMLFAATYEMNVHFKEGVFGVQEGQGVTLYGKRIGETKGVRFFEPDQIEQGVVVVVAVEAEYSLPKACAMKVASSIMGIGRPNIFIEITDPSSPEKLPRDGSGMIAGTMVNPLDQVVPPKTQITFEQAAEEIRDLAAALKPVAQNLGRLLEARGIVDVDLEKFSANLDTVVQRFDLVLKSINVVIGDEQNQANFIAALANTRKISESGVQAMENFAAISEEGKQTMKDATALMRHLVGTADDLSVVLKRMDQTLALMHDKQGSIGLLLNDNRLYEEMVLSARRLTSALDDLREVLDLAKKGKLRIQMF